MNSISCYTTEKNKFLLIRKGYKCKTGDLDDYGVNGVGPVWYVPWSIMGDDKYKITGDALEEMKADLGNAHDEVLERKGMTQTI